MRTTNAPYYIFIVLLWFAYLTMTFFQPISPNAVRFGLSETHIRLLSISIAVPLLFTWLMAAMSWLGIVDYAERTKEEMFKRGFGKIALGVLVLLIQLVSSSFVSTFRSLFLFSPEVVRLLTIILNYIYAFIPLFAFFCIFQGTRVLLGREETKEHVKDWVVFAITPTLLCAIFYVTLVFTGQGRQVSPGPGIAAAYYLSDLLIATTIIFPVLMAWFFGLAAGSNMNAFLQTTTTTTTTRRILDGFNNGLLLVILSSIILQMILSLGGIRFIGFGLGLTLFIIYLFLVIQFVGFLVMARASRLLAQSDIVIK